MKKILISVFVFLSSLLCFTGCYDAIFQSIRTEVELGDSTVTGFINGIVRFTPEGSTRQFLFVANGTIRVKDAAAQTSGLWYELSGLGLPSEVSYSYYDGSFSGEYIFKMAADDKYVYALSYAPYYDEDKSRNIPKSLYLYACKPTVNSSGILDFSNGWHRVGEINDNLSKYMSAIDSSYYSMNASVLLFCTNAVQPGHRKAYIRIGGKTGYSYSTTDYLFNQSYWGVYELNGSDTPKLLNFSTGYSGTYDDANKTSFVNNSVMGAVWFGGDILFTQYLNPVTNETADNDPTCVYMGNGEALETFNLTSYQNSSSTKNGKVHVHSNSDNTTVYYEGNFNLIKAYLASMTVTVTDESGNASTYSAGRPSAVSYIYYGGTIDSSICSLAVCSDYLLIGTGTDRSSGDGIFHVTLDSNGTPGLITSSFATNADSVMCAPYIIRSLLNVDPSKKEVESTLYSSMDFIYTESTAGTTIEDRGLWSYYPTTLEWNRE